MSEGSSLMGIIFSNFIGYDFIIFLLGGLNVFFLIKATRYSRELFSALNPTGWLPGGEKSLSELEEKYRGMTVDESRLVLLRRKTGVYHTLFENVTTLFPLFGILGTVVSLIPMVGAIGEVATGYFFTALTSTFWGIVFAILFKGLDGYIASQIEDNEKNVAVFLERNTIAMRKAAAEAEAIETEFSL